MFATAATYGHELADVFAVQDEVVRDIVDSLKAALPAFHLVPAKRTASIEAYDLFARGRALATLRGNGTQMARSLLERAIALDPEFADAHALLAMCTRSGWTDWDFYFSGFGVKERILTIAEWAMTLDPSNADAQLIEGYVHAYTGNLEIGSSEIDATLRRNSNNAMAWLFRGDICVLQGKTEQGVAAIQQAFALNPIPPSGYFWIAGWVYYGARRYDEALEFLRQDAMPGTGSLRLIAASLAQLGRTDEAREAAQRYLQSALGFTISGWKRTQPFRNPADLAHYVEGFRKAGLPN
jgi:adenylate cyclase